MSLNNTFEKTSLIAIGILVGVLARCSPLLSTNNASAAGSPKGGANGFLVGAVGTVTCPDGSTNGGR